MTETEKWITEEIKMRGKMSDNVGQIGDILISVSESFSWSGSRTIAVITYNGQSYCWDIDNKRKTLSILNSLVDIANGKKELIENIFTKKD